MPQNDTEAPLDGELELKKRSRRRLVGAAALALLAVVVLPMVMDHEPRQPAQDVQVRIPSPDTGGFTSRILPAKPAATPLPPAEPDSKAEAKPEARPEAKSEAKPEGKPEPKAEARPEAKADAKTEARPTESAKSIAKPTEKLVAKPAETAKPAEKETGKAEEARAKAALGGADTADQWAVQLGAYKEAANVKQLTGKLKQMGLPSFTEHFDSPQGPRTRVRAGPFKTQEAAEKARDRIRTIGVSGTVAKQ